MQHNLANDITEDSYLDLLNPEQREAVEAVDGAVLVLAGAGTGKTRVLTTRIAHIISTHRAFPNQILAVTFTNKASREMKERVAKALGRDTSGLWIGTFHSVCAKIMRRHAEVMGFKNTFTILDSDDQIRLLKKLYAEMQLDDKKWAPKIASAIIQGAKDKGWNPAQVDHGFGGSFADGRMQALYIAYQKRLKELNAMDFGDLLLHTLTMFRERPDILAEYHRYFRYILVDEYQDTNVAQYMWLRLLAQASGNICCVGDDDQSIYSWRGAEVGNILRFEKDYPDAKVIKLERNYRSTGNILGAASTLIANNRGRLGKTLWTEDEKGNLVRIKYLWDGEEEAKFVANEIEAATQTLTREKHKLSEFAILVRAGFQTRAFEERFLTLAIPYKVIGGLRFYERQEIRDACAYIKILIDPSNDLSFERIINVPKRGIGKSTLEALYRKSRAEGIPLYAATVAMVRSGELGTKSGKALKDLVDGFDLWSKKLANTPHEEVVDEMLQESGYIAMWKDEAQKEKSAEAEGRLENLAELIRAISEFESLPAFLDHISLVMDNDDAANGEMVNIMTLHAAKGLEFETVFLPGWEEGLFPHQRALDESGDSGLEEERRLAYVGITRARKNLYISHAANRRVYNQWQTSIPSRFFKELPEENTENLPNNMNFLQSNSGNNDRHRAFSARSGSRESATTFQTPQPVRGDGLAVGVRIFHQKFGYGKISKVNGENLDIIFDHTGLKTLKSSFVEKA
jgi:DNA helicase-2/ATP-dependent DNA helicase PcrA